MHCYATIVLLFLLQCVKEKEISTKFYNFLLEICDQSGGFSELTSSTTVTQSLRVMPLNSNLY